MDHRLGVATLSRMFLRKLICAAISTFFLVSVLLLLLSAEDVSAEDTIPSSFDLRDVDGVSAVKSQKGGTCWAHGTMSAMESNLMVTGLWGIVESNGTEPNLAEYHLDWWNGFNSHNNDDRTPPNGSGPWVHYGGDYLVSTAYLSRGEGAMRDKDAQYFDDPPERSLPQYHRYYPMDIEWYQMDDELNGIDEIKKAVMEHGALGTCMNADPNLRDNTHAHWQPPWDDREPNHAVAIVGWDDSKTTPAPDNGAWLIKNSWGTLWGNDGYFWISYYDRWACKHPEGTVSFRDVSYLTFDHALYHDYHGWRDTWTNSTESFNKFIVEFDEQMHGVSFYTTEDDVNVRISIWDDLVDGDLEKRSWDDTRFYEKTGLHTIMFDEPLELFKGDDIYIKLNVSGGGIAYDRTSLIPNLLDPTRGPGIDSWVVSFSAPNQSFFRNGSKWSDLYYENESANFCIKGLIGHVSFEAPRNDDKVGSNFTAFGPVSFEIDKVVVQIDDGPQLTTLIREGKWWLELRDLRLTQGVHRMTATATQDGCLDVVSTTFTEFIFDDDDPETSIYLNGTMGGDGWFLSQVDVELKASDPTSDILKIEYNVDGNGWVVYNSTLLVEGSGVHEVLFCAYDTSGNVEVVKSQEIKLDMVSPISDHFLLGDMGGDDWFVTWVTIRFSAYDDDSKVARINYILDGEEMEYDMEDPPVVSESGFNTLTYWAEDKAGNIGNRSQDSFRIDLERPLTNLIIDGEEGDNGWYISKIMFGLECSETDSGHKNTHYKIRPGSWEEYGDPIWINSDGKYEVEYYSEDLAGHSEVKRNAYIKVDTTAPYTNIMVTSEEEHEEIHLTPVRVELLPTDKTSGVSATFWKLDDRDLRGYAGQFDIDLVGEHMITYFSIDRAGNIEEKQSFTFNIDLHAPIISLDRDLHGRTFNITSLHLVPLGYDKDGNWIEFHYSLDGSEWKELSGDDLAENTIQNISEGGHELVLRGTDAAGRESFLTYEFMVNTSYIVDNTEIIIEDEPAGKDNWIPILIAVIIAVMVFIVLLSVLTIFIRKKKQIETDVPEV